MQFNVFSLFIQISPVSIHGIGLAWAYNHCHQHRSMLHSLATMINYRAIIIIIYSLLSLNGQSVSAV